MFILFMAWLSGWAGSNGVSGFISGVREIPCSEGVIFFHNIQRSVDDNKSAYSEDLRFPNAVCMWNITRSFGLYDSLQIDSIGVIFVGYQYNDSDTVMVRIDTLADYASIFYFFCTADTLTLPNTTGWSRDTLYYDIQYKNRGDPFMVILKKFGAGSGNTLGVRSLLIHYKLWRH